jgi:hypothetical protein
MKRTASIFRLVFLWQVLAHLVSAKVYSQSFPHIEQKPVFSQPGGFYGSPFLLSIESPDNTLSVWYTLDGSQPATSNTAMKGGASVSLWVDPASTILRAATPAVTVRACLAGKSGYSPSYPLTHTYIFSASVVTQHYPGGNWPTYNINGQWIDLAMDPKVTEDPRYEGLIENSLTAIPTLSLVTDNRNLFQPDSGIYVNAEGHGEDWEREGSVELIYPDGVSGFSANAGLRIRGGWSRHDEFPKHSFRLFFNSEYGDDKLRFPLFGTAGTDVFDKIDIKTAQNYSWANDNAYAAHNSFVRESFSRDLQGELGRPYTRSSFYQLFLNGMYWGLYETQERSEARFAESYLGGEEEGYDVVKVNMEDYLYDLEATDGNLSSWQYVYNLCTVGFATNTDYNRLQGRDATGKRVNGKPVYVDIDNLIDYMLVIFYTGNFDSPTSSFGLNKGCNNFYAIRNRRNSARGFVFFVHDAEHTLMAESISPGVGLYENRVSLGTRQDAYKMEMDGFHHFHPQWLHYRLSVNADYRMRFADRAFRLLQPGNPLSPEVCLSRFNRRTEEVEQAVVAESARWGDTDRPFAYTCDDAWMYEINEVRNDFIPYRSDILLNQLREAGLYPAIDPPVIQTSSGEIHTAWYEFEQGTTLSVARPGQSGTIYYTIDNTDPRFPNGQINPAALHSSQTVTLPLTATTPVKARMYFNGSWSALNHIDFLGSNDDYTSLKVTELMYNPTVHIQSGDTLQSSSLEFIEFRNTGDSFLNLSGFHLDSAVQAAFPENTILGPGSFLVAASKPYAFSSLYGVEPTVNYSGNFDNSGEEVLLTDPQGMPVISFAYDDYSPWPTLADGQGYSLTAETPVPTGNPGDAGYWRPSTLVYGSPFSNDTGEPSDIPETPSVLLSVYPNPASSWLVVELDEAEAESSTFLQLFNSNGHIVYAETFNRQTRIDIAGNGLKAGVYVLKVTARNSLFTRKIVIL